MAKIKKSAVTKRSGSSIIVTEPGTFFIRDDQINQKCNRFWFETFTPGIKLKRADLVKVAKWCIDYNWGRNCVGTGDLNSNLGPALNIEDEPINIKFPSIAAAAEKAAGNIEFTIEDLAKLQAKLEAGEIEWFEVPDYSLDKIAHNKNKSSLNIGGFLVLASDIYPDGSRTRMPVCFQGRRDSKAFAPFGNYKVYRKNGRHHDYSTYGNTGIPALTLINPQTLEPDFEKTVYWHANENPEILDRLYEGLAAFDLSAGSRQGGVYISEGWQFLKLLPKTEPSFKDLPNPAELIAIVNKNMAELEGCPDVRVASGSWIPVRYSDHQPVYTKDGKFSHYDEEKMNYTYRWGLRLHFEINIKGKWKVWGPAKAAWASYRPDIDEERPVRLIKSTNCERKNRWSKMDSSIAGTGFMNQIVPDHTHAICMWAPNSFAQMCNTFPKSRKPTFVGSKSKLKTLNRLKRSLQTATMLDLAI